MQNWKRFVFAGAAGASTILFLKGRKSAGFVAAGVGIAALANEYPEEFANLQQKMPRYLLRASGVLAMASRIGLVPKASAPHSPIRRRF
jgi:hypothetical protein